MTLDRVCRLWSWLAAVLLAAIATTTAATVAPLGSGAHINYRQSTGSRATLTRIPPIQYGFDTSGNRTSAKRTPRPTGTVDLSTQQAQANAYDPLQRLIQMNYQVGLASSTTLTNYQNDQWTLDLLGNWSSHSATYNNNAPVVTTNVVDAKNQILQIHQGSTPDKQPVYDAAGNMIFDGTYAYQYDAWNRLIQVNRGHMQAGAASFAPGDSTGIPQIVYADELLKHYTYDGLGRLVRTQSPFPEVGPESDLRTERFYYDGIRRIQEFYVDPLLSLSNAMASSQGSVSTTAQAVAYAAPQALDESATPLQVEQAQLGFATPSSSATPIDSTPVNHAYLAREYIWGPGDRGIDELFVQFDENRQPWWVMQDGGLDVVAMFDMGGTSSTARVVGEWTYDAYGEPIARWTQTNAAISEPHAGHKGLFFDRLDAGVADPYSGAETPRLVADAVGHYHVRNRVLSPKLGRWLQADPNATGQVVCQIGFAHGVLCSPADISTRFGDGISLFQYARGNPVLFGDVVGLFSFIDIICGSTSLDELESDWNQQIANFGQDVYDLTEATLASGSMQQQIDASWAMDWDKSDSAYSGGTKTDQANGQSSTVGLDVGQEREVAGIGTDHHIVSKFIGGVKSRANHYIIKLTEEAHQLFHTKLNEKLKFYFKKIDRAGATFWKGKMKNAADRELILKAFRETIEEVQRECPGKYLDWLPRFESLLKEMKL